MPKSNFHRIIISLKHFYTMKTFHVSNFLQKEHLLDKIFSLYTYVIFPNGWRTFIKSVSLQPSATALQWITREGGVLWCAVEFNVNDCGILRLEVDVSAETDELGDNE